MSRNRSRAELTRHERPARPGEYVETPMLRLPHLADAALRSGTEERSIRVELPEPQQMRTPGAQLGRWLSSGQMLPDLDRPDITDSEPWEGFER